MLLDCVVSVFAPDVFVAFEDPKEAKAPDPRPKAEDAPTVGEAMPDVAVGVKALNGLALPWEDKSPPNLLEDGNGRGESALKMSLLAFEWDVESVSLLVLVSPVSRNSKAEGKILILRTALSEVIHKEGKASPEAVHCARTKLVAADTAKRGVEVWNEKGRSLCGRTDSLRARIGQCSYNIMRLLVIMIL